MYQTIKSMLESAGRKIASGNGSGARKEIETLFTLEASAGPEISRTSRPAASVILIATLSAGFLSDHEINAACGGFSPKNVWSPQNS